MKKGQKFRKKSGLVYLVVDHVCAVSLLVNYDCDSTLHTSRGTSSLYNHARRYGLDNEFWPSTDELIFNLAMKLPATLVIEYKATIKTTGQGLQTERNRSTISFQ